MHDFGVVHWLHKVYIQEHYNKHYFNHLDLLNQLSLISIKTPHCH